MENYQNSQYYLLIEESSKKIPVLSFYSCDYKVSGDYCFKIKIKVGVENLLLKRAKLVFNGFEISGIVTDVFLNENYATIWMKSFINGLKGYKNSRVYLEKTVAEILEALLLENHLNYSINLSSSHPKYDFYLQYKESDYEFFLRVLKSHNIFYFFDGDKLIVSDSFKKGTSQHDFKIVSQQVDFESQKNIVVESLKPNIMPGFQVDKYKVIQSELFGNQAPESLKVNQARIRNKLTLIPADDELSFIHKPKRFYGMVTATIESPNNQKPFLDKEGKYHVRFCFDKSNQPKGKASHAIASLQATTGMHFPFHDGEKVLVAFQEGDLNQPVIMGSISQNTPPHAHQNYFQTQGENTLVMSDNPVYIELHTPKKNSSIGLYPKRLKLEAKTGGLTASSGDSTYISAKHVKKTIHHDHIVKAGEIFEVTSKDISITANDCMIFDCQNDFKIKSREKIIEMASKESTTLTANQTINMTAMHDDIFMTSDYANINFNADNNIQVRSKNSINLSSIRSSIELDQHGNITITAKTIYLDGETVTLNGNLVAL